ncbi:polysaccharide biosynthesis protein [Nitritalea halalkaliphila LW7]|uniref:Polysaccharide biosynthesis protein n=1 Tax=Nitritalea halalkaliphila LW7 TaxID=1189621 RepID=I5C5Z6_9BACT|nr:polysaccharide biosynthesis protein [Nitritalea halalkaliphila]EIM77248.1 polysaccharide biosynthesis protein [Nitritalea halalkaliphila LW7]
MLACIVQARLGSSRLPNKILLPFYEGKSVLEILLTKISAHFPSLKLIVATTVSLSDQPIVDLCEKLQVSCFKGDEADVLSRFIDAAEAFQVEKIIRICSDNPLLNLMALQELIQISASSAASYVSFKTSAGTPTIKTHYGLWAEYVTVEALKQVKQLTQESLYREHVTNYIYANSNVFSTYLAPIAKQIEQYPQLRMTLDTKADFELLQQIYAEIPNFDGSPEQLIEKIAANEEWLQIMHKQIIQNEK